MADVLQPAATGRAKCRGCGRAIPTGELRFGESVPNPYAEGETTHWLHLTCGACMRPEKFLPVLAASDRDIPDRAWLKAAAVFGVAHPRVARLAHAERSKSGKARCRSCREVIAGGVMRLALLIFEEGRMSPIGFIHVECAQNYFGTAEILDRIVRLTPGLDETAKAELAAGLRAQRAPKPTANDASDGDATPPSEGPELAKTRPLEGADAAAKRARNS